MVLFMACVVDLIFLGDDTFVYDPNYKNWQRRLEQSR